jgi:hypothetical protein
VQPPAFAPAEAGELFLSIMEGRGRWLCETGKNGRRSEARRKVWSQGVPHLYFLARRVRLLMAAAVPRGFSSWLNGL